MSTREIAKHREIYQRIHRAIISGEYAVGQRIPTEAELGAVYHVSRPTISRALRDLEQQGYLLRRRGAGTFVREFQRASGGLLGLTVPHTEGGILGPICAEIVQRADASGHSVLYGGTLPRHGPVSAAQADAFCERFIARGVVGVFFLPLILPREQMDMNLRIADRLSDAGIAIVLLDHDIVDYPQRSRYDLVGVDNRRNGTVLTEHLLAGGCRRIHFVTIDLTVSTSTARIAGYQDALRSHGIEPDPSWVHRWNTAEDGDFVRRLMREARAEAFVCVNDDVARTLLLHLATLGVRVPEDVRIVSFDDLPFAATLPVPLTTLHQPTRDIGAVAVETMLSRIAAPNRPPRDVHLACELRIRDSCGVRSGRPPAPGRAVAAVR